MCSENHSFCLVNIPVISPSFFVNIRDSLDLTLCGKTILCYAGNIKSILHLPCRMVLWSEQRIKVPETRLSYRSIDFCKSQADKYFLYLVDYIHQRVLPSRIESWRRCYHVY